MEYTDDQTVGNFSWCYARIASKTQVPYLVSADLYHTGKNPLRDRCYSPSYLQSGSEIRVRCQLEPVQKGAGSLLIPSERRH